jgi:hypothetical protein
MNFESRTGKGYSVSEVNGTCASIDELNPEQEQEQELYEALRDFRLSVCAWSEATMSKPLTVVETGRRWSWRLATAVALGFVLIAVGVSGGIYMHLHRQLATGWKQHPQETRMAAAHAIGLDQPAVAQQRNQPTRKEEDDLLAKVDSDVSRQVPVAMEPLAQLMAGEVTR